MVTGLKEKKIKSVAIIGGSPSGIATLYDLTRTLKDGTSLQGYKNIKDFEERKEVAFDKIVLFERNHSTGGVWCRQTRGNFNNDPSLPDLSSKGNFEDPANVFIKAPISEELEEQLLGSSFEHPVEVEKQKSKPEDIYQWKSSAAYEKLFTNVPNQYMSFSFDPLSSKQLAELRHRYKNISGFESADDVGLYLENVLKNNDLTRYIRTSSNVERVKKLSAGGWRVFIRKTVQRAGTDIDQWYKEDFDAVVIANGKTVPIIPSFKGFREFAAKTKEKIWITLAKSLKDPRKLRTAKKILIIGSSVSAVDLVQYAFPRDLDTPSIFISRRSESHAGRDWADFCSHTRGIISKPEIDHFNADTESIIFKDGTVEKGFDAVIVCTGYHMYYPFLESKYLKIHPNALKFFDYTFSIEDQTLALVGNTYAAYFFNRVEAQAAALAGVWSGQKYLPTLKEQLYWYKTEFPEPLKAYRVAEHFIKPLERFFLRGRKNPLDSEEKKDHVADLGLSRSTLQIVFNKIRRGELKAEEVI